MPSRYHMSSQHRFILTSLISSLVLTKYVNGVLLNAIPLDQHGTPTDTIYRICYPLSNTESDQVFLVDAAESSCAQHLGSANWEIQDELPFFDMTEKVTKRYSLTNEALDGYMYHSPAHVEDFFRFGKLNPVTKDYWATTFFTIWRNGNPQNIRSNNPLKVYDVLKFDGPAKYSKDPYFDDMNRVVLYMEKEPYEAIRKEKIVLGRIYKENLKKSPNKHQVRIEVADLGSREPLSRSRLLSSGKFPLKLKSAEFKPEVPIDQQPQSLPNLDELVKEDRPPSLYKPGGSNSYQNWARLFSQPQTGTSEGKTGDITKSLKDLPEEKIPIIAPQVDTSGTEGYNTPYEGRTDSDKTKSSPGQNQASDTDTFVTAKGDTDADDIVDNGGEGDDADQLIEEDLVEEDEGQMDQQRRRFVKRQELAQDFIDSDSEDEGHDKSDNGMDDIPEQQLQTYDQTSQGLRNNNAVHNSVGLQNFQSLAEDKNISTGSPAQEDDEWTLVEEPVYQSPTGQMDKTFEKTGLEADAAQLGLSPEQLDQLQVINYFKKIYQDTLSQPPKPKKSGKSDSITGFFNGIAKKFRKPSQN